MESVVIIAAGEFPKKEYPRYLIQSATHIVCCDGNALANFLRASKSIFGYLRLPDAVVGDMDSLSDAQRKRYGDLLVEVAEQDDNDMTKSVRYVLETWPTVNEIHIVGAGGKREDHTIGNMGLLMEYIRLFGLTGVPCGSDCVDGFDSDEASGSNGASGSDDASGSDLLPSGRRKTMLDAVSDYTTAFAIADSCEIAVGEGRSISIFSPDNSLTLTSEGLEWQTSGVRFDNWWQATLNRATSDTIRLTFSHPSLVLIILL